MFFRSPEVHIHSMEILYSSDLSVQIRHFGPAAYLEGCGVSQHPWRSLSLGAQSSSLYKELHITSTVWVLGLPTATCSMTGWPTSAGQFSLCTADCTCARLQQHACHLPSKPYAWQTSERVDRLQLDSMHLLAAEKPYIHARSTQLEGIQ